MNKKSAKRYLFEEVLDLLKQNRGRALNYKQIAAGLEIDNEAERFMIIEVLNGLKQQDLVTEPERGKYAFKENKTLIEGTIDFISSGSAYVIVEGEDQDIFVEKGKTKDALQGDRVRIQLEPARGRGKSTGTVLEVIKRNRTEFVGTIQVGAKFCFVVPDSHKVHVDFFVPFDKSRDARNGQKVLVRLKGWYKGDENPTAEVIEVFGYPGEHKTEMHAIMAEFGLPPEFPKHLEKAARAIPTEITFAEIKKRRDFREVLTFTIDPVDAKDFDDALSFQVLDNGNYEIGVHIADVSHYMKPGTAIDEEAIHRATSVYLVDRVVPMLPEILSNFVCSLRPNEEKLCFSAVFELDQDANIKKEWFGRTVIFSDRRFTYEEVQQIIETEEGDHAHAILALDKLAKKLRNERMKKGSIFFDKEEVKFHLAEDGTPLGVYFKIQQDAHKLIEDFMLLANRRVAELLTKNGANAELKSRRKKDDEGLGHMVYRVHDVPSEQKLSTLSETVAKFGYSLKTRGKKETVSAINNLLKEVKGKGEANMIELLAIRSMPKAVYTTKNIGHYGLGFDYYTHFTSPIRRYPDVLVHRLLEAYLNKEKYSSPQELELLCKHSSEQEKMAADAERASVKFKQVEFLHDKVGEEFEGLISGVTDWGIFVEIIENRCEGMVRIHSMRDDSYYFDEENFRYVGRKTGKVYRLGDKVTVVVKNADLMKKQLDFVFAGGSQTQELNRDDLWFGDSRQKKGQQNRGQRKGGHKGAGKKRRR